MSAEREHVECVGATVTPVRCSAEQIDSRAAHIAVLLQDLGASRGHHVALSARSTPDNVAAVVAVRALGLRAVPVDPAFSLQATAFAINDSRARIVLVDCARAALVDELRPLTPYVEAYSFIDARLTETSRPVGLRAVGETQGSLHYSAVATARPVGFRVPDPLDDPVGRRDVAALVGGRRLGAGDTLLLASDLSDPAALQLAVVVHAARGSIVTTSGVEPEEIAAVIATHEPTITHLSPQRELSRTSCRPRPARSPRQRSGCGW